MEKFKNWLIDRFSTAEPKPPADIGQTGAMPRPKVRPKVRKSVVRRTDATRIKAEPPLYGKIEDAGPGKNVLTRTQFIREDTGTHETLKILDESLEDSGDDDGIDPYNTGKFDRSKNWNNRFRK